MTMKLDRRAKRSTRTRSLNVESLGERIAPAVTYIGVMGAAHNVAVYQVSEHKFEKILHFLQQHGQNANRLRHHGKFVGNPYLNLIVAPPVGAKFHLKHLIPGNPPIQPPPVLATSSANVASLATGGNGLSQTGPADPNALPPFQ